MREQSVAERHEPSAPVSRVPGHVAEIVALGRPAPKPDVPRKIKPAFEFSKAVLLEENHMKTGTRTLSGAIAVLLHVGIITGVILAGLYFADPLNIKQYASTILIAPPPPAPPPPPATGAITKPKVVHHVFMNAGKLIVPTVIPKHIAMIKEAPLGPDSLGGVVGGVPGGVPGGQLGGVLGGVIGGVSSNSAKPVPRLPELNRTAQCVLAGTCARQKQSA